MKCTFTVVVYAAFAVARPVVDTSGKAPGDMVNKRQLDALTGLLGEGATGGQGPGNANPLAGLLGGAGGAGGAGGLGDLGALLGGGGAIGGSTTASGTSSASNSSAGASKPGGLRIPKREGTKTKREAKPQLDALTGLLGGATGTQRVQASNVANPLAVGLGDLIPIKKD